LNEIFPDIYELLPSKPTPKKYRSFFIKHEAGNVLIPCYANSSTIEAHFDAIHEMGGLSRQLLGDSHFRSAHCDVVAERFNAPLYCSLVEAPDVTPKLKHVVTFPFERHLLDEHIEVIPTPGHRPGGVCYLITSHATRYLFVGDFIWHDGERWIPTAAKATHRAYIASLLVVERLAVDVLIANSMLSNATCAVKLQQETRTAFIAAVLAQLRA
jgi:hydroxyacylglutathione hydrolase